MTYKKVFKQWSKNKKDLYKETVEELMALYKMIILTDEERVKIREIRDELKAIEAVNKDELSVDKANREVEYMKKEIDLLKNRKLTNKNI